MRSLAGMFAALLESLEVFGHGGSGIRHRRMEFKATHWIHQGHYALNWTRSACYDVNDNVPLRSGLRLVTTPR